jgi:adenylate cyclase
MVVNKTMATEIERKFLLKNDMWRDSVAKYTYFKQGYLVGSDKASVRVRIEGQQANINIKSATLGVTRKEYEYSIPLEDAQELLNNLCQQPLIEKTRHYVYVGNHEWEIDEFKGDNQGLIVAEIELKDEMEEFIKPEWLGQEVSHEKKYYNSLLVKKPYKNW